MAQRISRVTTVSTKQAAAHTEAERAHLAEAAAQRHAEAQRLRAEEEAAAAAKAQHSAATKRLFDEQACLSCRTLPFAGDLSLLLRCTACVKCSSLWVTYALSQYPFPRCFCCYVALLKLILWCTSTFDTEHLRSAPFITTSKGKLNWPAAPLKATLLCLCISRIRH